MDGQKYSLKDVFRLRIRICILLVLIIFILGFIFSPEVKVEPKITPPPIPPLVPFEPTEEMVDVNEIPTNDINEVIDKEFKEEYKDKEPVTENPSSGNKEPGIESGDDVIFYAYEVAPVPLNLDEVNFEYPRSIRMLGVEGTVCLQLLIDKRGDVRDVKIIDSLHPALDKVAVEKAWKIRFLPAQQRDKAVSVYYSFPVEFKLE
jgi:TonB family protein